MQHYQVLYRAAYIQLNVSWNVVSNFLYKWVLYHKQNMQMNKADSCELQYVFQISLRKNYLPYLPQKNMVNYSICLVCDQMVVSHSRVKTSIIFMHILTAEDEKNLAVSKFRGRQLLSSLTTCCIANRIKDTKHWRVLNDNKCFRCNRADSNKIFK